MRKTSLHNWKLQVVPVKAFFFVAITYLFSQSACTKPHDNGGPDAPASLSTVAITDLGPNTLTAGGTITSEGGSPVTARGVVWSTSPTPLTILPTITIDGTGKGTYSSKVIDLFPETKYYLRAYAINNAGSAYGNEISFTTPAKPPLTIDQFYKKTLDASGIPIVSSDKVSDEALSRARNIIIAMVSFRSDILAKLIINRVRVGVMAKTEVTTDMPEHSDLNTALPPTDWNKFRGIAATISRPLSTCAEENVMCSPQSGDPYYNEDILVHEFAHTFHQLGIRAVEPGIDKELQDALKDALANNRWKNTYAGANYLEYFAEGVQCWFNVNAQAIPSNGIHNDINTRSELEVYDPALYNIVKRYFSPDTTPISCHFQN
jgi:hypothetical protein